MTSEWGDYTPRTKKGPWTSMCNIAAQARSIAYAVDLRPTPQFAMASGIWKGDWPAMPKYGGSALNEPDFSGNEYWEANAKWWSLAMISTDAATRDTSFLSTYFNSAISPTELGTDNIDGRGNVLKTISQDYLAVTWIMKKLDDVTTGLSEGGASGAAKALGGYDNVAAAFLGCGNNSPTPLPSYPNVTWGNSYATKGPTFYSVAATMQQMSASYGGQNATTGASTAAEAVVQRLQATPSAEGVASIKDAIYTVYAQKTLRYAANMTLDAHLPGNGMGGSTKRIAVDGPQINAVGVTACGINQQGLTGQECSAITGRECDDDWQTFHLAGSPGPCAGDREPITGGCSQTGQNENQFFFDYPLCCNIASNAPANLVMNPNPIFGPILPESFPPGTGWVEWNWIGAGLQHWHKEDAVAAADALARNQGVIYPWSPSSDLWGGLNRDEFGIITQPQSGCTNARANAMGVGNSQSLLKPYDENGRYAMSQIETTLLPYYIGAFGSTGSQCGKLEMIPDGSRSARIANPCGTDMASRDSNHCTNGGNPSTGADLTAEVISNVGLVNPRIASVLGGMAAYQIIVAMQDGASDTIAVAAGTNQNCAANLFDMFSYNVGALMYNDDHTTLYTGTPVPGAMPGAVSFPLWLVAIGEDDTGLGGEGFVVPNGFCYASACLTEFLKSVSTDKAAKMGTLVKNPNMGKPLTTTSKCGQAYGACADIAGFSSEPGKAGRKWDGKEWPVPQKEYGAGNEGLGSFAGADVPAFTGPVY